jgi:hypothetical protein
MNVMTVEIDFSLPFDGCYNGCLAFNDFCSFWLFEHTVEMAACDQVCGGYFMSTMEMATVGLQVTTRVVS